MNSLASFLQQLALEDAVLVTVQSTRGSVPREVGAWMAVFAHTTVATIGGGHLEWQAMAHARTVLAQAAGQGPSLDRPELHRYALGPSLGQCCGGEMQLGFARVSAQDIAALRQQLHTPYPSVALFGGGHVGQALARVLAPLPFALHWIDSRDAIFPDDVPPQVQCEHSLPVEDAVADLPPGALVLIMSFSHAEDLQVVAACLERQRTRGDLPFIGLIGSQTKWASFRQRLLARGLSEAELAQVHCPLGVPGIRGKQPEVIAVAIAAQLLQQVPATIG